MEVGEGQNWGCGVKEKKRPYNMLISSDQFIGF
jgi:hypothetical protein